MEMDQIKAGRRTKEDGEEGGDKVTRCWEVEQNTERERERWRGIIVLKVLIVIFNMLLPILA